MVVVEPLGEGGGVKKGSKSESSFWSSSRCPLCPWLLELEIGAICSLSLRL